jgi:hypothetical protein
MPRTPYPRSSAWGRQPCAHLVAHRGTCLAFATALLVGACAPPVRSPQPPDPDHVTLTMPGYRTEAQLTSDGFSGPEIMLSRNAEGYRGEAFRQTVELRLEEGRILGFLASTPVDLHLGASGTATVVRGLFGGGLSNLNVSDATLEGSVGRCSYQLRASATYEHGYEGRRVCAGSRFEYATLRLPMAYDRLAPNERIALLLVLLGH